MRSRPGPRLTAGVAIVLIAAGLGTPAQAEPGKGPARAPQPAPQRQCGLRPTPHAAPQHEWASCLSVSADLARPLAVGETVQLAFDVTAEHAETGVRIEADLPGNLRWVTVPQGMTVAAQSSRDPAARGRLDRAATRRDLAAGRTVRYQGTVTATGDGPAEIRVRASVAVPGGTDAAEDSVFLTVGAPGRASTRSITPEPVGGTRKVPTGVTPEQATGKAPRRTVPTTGLPRPTSDDRASGDVGTQATACVTGGWFYVDNNGATRPSINMQVEAWDYDSTSGDDLLASAVTGWDGRYTLCFDNSDGIGAGTQDVYVRFITRNSLWRVRRTGTNNDYVYTTGRVDDVADGSTTNFGNLQPADNAQMRGLHAFDSANAAWNWKPGTCWDTPDTSCRQVVINWAPDSTDGTYYSPGANDVHLAAADPDAPHTVVHEIGHAVMDDVYEDAMPSSPNCNPHTIQGSTSTGCAWVEGWAEWFPAMVFNDPFYRWPSGASLNLETPTWGTAGWGTGDTVEGRVAGSLIDISDYNNEAYWDVYGEGAPGNVWTTFTRHVSNTMAEFWNHRAADGFNTADSGALSDLYQNTIDYGFRNPLGNYAELTRPTPQPHLYGYGTSSIYWSVVAVRPPTGADYDLTLYDDRGLGTALGSSTYGGNTVDFVAVDSNRRALGDYYPRVYAYSGSGTYQVELAQGTEVLSAATSQSVGMGYNDVVVVRDVYLAAGETTTVSATPGNTGQDAELFLYASDANSATWVRPRSSAAATASAAGAGGAEAFTYTAPTAGWYGLVLVNRAGSGTYTLSRS